MTPNLTVKMEEEAVDAFTVEDGSVDYNGRLDNKLKAADWRSTPFKSALDNVNWRIICVPLGAAFAILLTYNFVDFMGVKISPYQSLGSRGSQIQCQSQQEPRPAFDVCLMVNMGDDGQTPPGNSTLPFTVLHRLFDMVKKLIQEEEHDPMVSGKVFVGVDHPSIVCKMVRDATLAVEAVCLSFDEMQANETKVGCKHMVVGKSSRFVNQLSEVGVSRSTWKHIHFVDMEKPSFQTPSLAAIQPTIVTGFSKNHFTVGLLLLRSIGKAAADARELNRTFDVSVVVWTMDKYSGKEEQDLSCVVKELNEQWKVRTEVREFDFMGLPKWMHINQTLGYFGGTGEYAWKVIMIHTVFCERGLVLWVDAGDRFKTVTALTGTLAYITDHGFASRESSGAIHHWTFPAQIQYLRAAGIDMMSRNCDGSIVGFSLKRYEDLLLPWYECAMTRQCIAPDGSDRSNHRQDQAALTVLATMTTTKCQGASWEIGHQMDGNLNDFVGANMTSCYNDPRKQKVRMKIP